MIKFNGITLAITVVDLDKLLATVTTRSLSLDSLIHKAGLSAIYHTQQTKDSGYVKQLIAAVPNGPRRKALVAWFEAFMPIKPILFDGDKISVKLVKNRKDEDWQLDDAATSPWVAFKPAAKPRKALDGDAFEKRIAGLCKQGVTDNLLSEAATVRIMTAVQAEFMVTQGD